MRINTKKLLKNDRSVMLACDHGLERGPKDFNLKNIDPQYVLDIALEGNYNSVILHSGIAEKYYHEAYKDIPLVVKLNGKTSSPYTASVSQQVCSVDRAIKLGASAVGYTVFGPEQTLLGEFGSVVERAHDYGIPVIAWMRPQSAAASTDLLAYSARMGLELGADFVNVKYNNDPEGFKWVVKNAGRTRVLAAGGSKQNPKEFLHRSREILSTGATGIAVGRNIWQDHRPYALTQAVRDLMFHNKRVEDVLHYLNE